MKTIKGCHTYLFSIILIYLVCNKDTDNSSFLNFKPEIASKYNEIAKEYEKETGIK